MTQISKLKAAANAPAIVPRLVEVGTGIPLNSESPRNGLTFNPQLTVGAAGRAASGPHAGRQGLSGTVVTWGSGIRGQLLDGPGQGPAPGPWCITGK